MSNLRLQSAMEYLMTYGWAVLIIAVVLGALYQIGIFGGSAGALQPSCLASTGFYCTTPIMNTTGYLGTTFGQIGQQCNIYNGNVICVGGYNGGSYMGATYYAPLLSPGIGTWTSSNAYPLGIVFSTCVIQ